MIPASRSGSRSSFVPPAAGGVPAHAVRDHAFEPGELERVASAPYHQGVDRAARQDVSKRRGERLAEAEPDRQADDGEAAETRGHRHPEPFAEGMYPVEPEDLHDGEQVGDEQADVGA